MPAKSKMANAFANFRRRLEWGGGATGIGAPCAGNIKPNPAGATPPPSTRSARQSGREAEHLPRLFKTCVQPDAITTLFLARSRIAKRCGSGRAERPAAHAKSLIAPTTEDTARRRSVVGAPAWRTYKRGLVVCVAIATGLSLVATAASAALTQHGDLFVTFAGGIAPLVLPRQALAPISVTVSGEVRTPPGTTPPPLRQIAISLNRDGHLDTTGLPICHASQLEGTTSAQALAACRDALIGNGTYVAQASFPEHSTFPAQGHILAFNGSSEGRAVILAHIYGTNPVPGTSVITFYIQHPHGAYGTRLIDNLPASLNHYGYVKRISLTLHRTYTYRGQTYSYLSASCPAPPGFPGASFNFAHASMTFEGGVTLASTLVRNCRVGR